MRRLSLAALMGLVLLLTGCGGSEEEPATGPTSPSSAAPTTQAALTLREACTPAERLTPKGLAPSRDRASVAYKALQALADRSDAETKVALKPLIESLRGQVLAAAGSAYAEQYANQTAAMQRMADRCSAVGSSAFQ